MLKGPPFFEGRNNVASALLVFRCGSPMFSGHLHATFHAERTGLLGMSRCCPPSGLVLRESLAVEGSHGVPGPGPENVEKHTRPLARPLLLKLLQCIACRANVVVLFAFATAAVACSAFWIRASIISAPMSMQSARADESTNALELCCGVVCVDLEGAMV